jgi:bleomycin hydrolase
MDSNLYVPERLYRLGQQSMHMSKAERLACRQSVPTHAMVFTGVDVEKDQWGKSHVTKWRVENSWGKGGKGDAKGFIAMSSSWFHDYVFQVVVDVQVLDQRVVEGMRSETPITLPPWDAFGTVA